MTSTLITGIDELITDDPDDGGGIASTREATAAASDDQLRTLVAQRVAEVRGQGTTTIEIKSGYGLTVAEEVRQLRGAAELSQETTFLGAHAVVDASSHLHIPYRAGVPLVRALDL